MAKPKERKPQPNPEVWKWCKHPECLKWARVPSSSRLSKTLMALHRALYLECYCWTHLDDKKRIKYKEKIEKLVALGHSLEKANLREADLHGACLTDAKLMGVDLRGANLQKADLGCANLEGALLWNVNLKEAALLGANLKGADISESNLVETYLPRASLEGANLSESNLQKAFLSEADFRDADLSEVNLKQADLYKANFEGANLQAANLQGASLMGANFNGAALATTIWDGALWLTWNRIEKGVAEEHFKYWATARDAYRRLKNHFHQQGQYVDESKAYFRERLMAKHEAFWGWFYGYQPVEEPEDDAKKEEMNEFTEELKGKGRTFLKSVAYFFRWFGLWFSWAVMGFGERWWLTALWAVGFIIGFGLLYFWGTNAGWGPLLYKGSQEIKSIWDCLYFSVVTFATLGFGDISPALKSWAKLPVIGEVIMGYVFLGTLVTIIARKMGR